MASIDVEWLEITEPANYNGSAVYEIRIVERGEPGEPAIIDRFLASDDRGVISIGMTTNMETRRRQFVSGMTRGRAILREICFLGYDNLHLLIRSFLSQCFNFNISSSKSNQKRKPIEWRVTASKRM